VGRAPFEFYPGICQTTEEKLCGEAHGKIFKNSVRTAKKTPHFTITKINWLTLFTEIIATYSENHTKPINTLRGHNVELLVIKAGGPYGYHWALKG
jgi:hypothetical protein